MATFEKAQKIVGINEGGYQYDPRDEGNYYAGHLIGTNYGISAPTLAGYLGRIPTVDDMKSLSRTAAEEILKINYWLKNNLGDLKNQSVATLIYDGTVNHGINGMRLLLEKALRKVRQEMSYYNAFTESGIQQMNKVDQKKLFDAIKNVRREKYMTSAQKQYVTGWLHRLDKIQYSEDNSSLRSVLPYAVLFITGLGLLILGI